MKPQTLINLLARLLPVATLSCYWYVNSRIVHIEKSITDERGLTSVIYTQGGKEWALDYLTPQELDSLKYIK